MSGTQQTEALRLAEYLDDLFDADGEPKQAAAELRHQHARIEDLEEQLSAIGAGGVEPLRKRAVRRAPAEPVISETQVLAITTAYEQGVGKGHQSHARKEAITNPYSDEWGCDSAWQMGYDEGREQAESKASAPLPPEAAQSNSLEFGGIKTEATP